MHKDGESSYARFMKDAVFMITNPALLDKVISMLDEIPMHDRDTKGDLYEYLLSKLTTAGRNGQFRTPRHIIKMMVALTTPGPGDIIGDPAGGTCGFLMCASEYLRDNCKAMFRSKKQVEHFLHTMFTAYDSDITMCRIGAMNLFLHGIENPTIEQRDSLSNDYEEEDVFTLILANPPFKGSLDYDSTSKSLQQMVKTKKTELLFLGLFLRLLKPRGRCACIVPDGVLFGSSKAHKQIRKTLIDGHKLDGVISMPSGVFKPYAGVSTAVLVFTKTNSGGTDNVWFYDMQADGFSLDDKRTPLDGGKHEHNNIPDIIGRWGEKDKEKRRKRRDQSFMVPVEEIIENEYDLSINRYKEIVYEEVEYDPPGKIIGDLEKLEEEIQRGLGELKGMVK
jgi:type I restriction enzyme M protein